MSNFEFKLPDIGEGVTEGEIVSWLVNVGDQVAEDQDMVEVMTDKATVTIGAPKAGKIVELRGTVGDVVPVGDILVVMALVESGGSASPPAAGTSETTASAVGDIKDHLPGISQVPEAPAKPVVERAASDYFSEKPLAAPATRKLARALGVDLRVVVPTGSGGRVTREDVQRFAGQRGKHPAGPPPRPAKVSAEQPTPEDERLPLRGMRKRIFENMARSKRTAAHFTYVDECDVQHLRAVRARVSPHAEKIGVKLTFLPFIIKAVAIALRAHPKLNCVMDDEAQEIVLRKTYDIGIATATDAGLVVPVLRGADRLSIIEMAREIERLASVARAGKIAPEDVGGSSFTVTSLGKLGGLFATPVINYPEVAILGVHEMKRRPVVSGDQIVIGEVMLLSLSFDHRVIDGDVGARFAQQVIQYLQEPELLLLEMK